MKKIFNKNDYYLLHVLREQIRQVIESQLIARKTDEQCAMQTRNNESEGR